MARAAAGASGARHSLRPLIGEGGTLMANLAQNMRRDREAVSCSHCERSEAIHTYFAAKWIASLRSQ
jgi:hypothetical protein